MSRRKEDNETSFYISRRDLAKSILSLGAGIVLGEANVLFNKAEFDAINPARVQEFVSKLALPIIAIYLNNATATVVGSSTIEIANKFPDNPKVAYGSLAITLPPEDVQHMNRYIGKVIPGRDLVTFTNHVSSLSINSVTPQGKGENDMLRAVFNGNWNGTLISDRRNLYVTTLVPPLASAPRRMPDGSLQPTQPLNGKIFRQIQRHAVQTLSAFKGA